MRKFAVAFALTVAAVFPAAASAHNINDEASNVTCTKATIQFVNFTAADRAEGIKLIAQIGGHTVAVKQIAPNDPAIAGKSNFTLTIDYPSPADNDTHWVRVTGQWATGSDSFSDTVSNCCPPKPCCTDGKPGPAGPPGAPGTPGPAVPPGTGTNTTTTTTLVVEKVVVVEKSCTSKRVYRFLVKRRVRLETDNVLRLVTAVRASENRFRVSVHEIRRGGHRRWLVTVRPRKGGIKAVPGQVFNTNVSVRLKGKGKRWYALGERRRLCMPADGNLNAPSASGPARG